MAAIIRHRTVIDHLTGRNRPAAPSPYAPNFAIAKPSYTPGKPHLVQRTKPAINWLFYALLAVIVAATAIAIFVSRYEVASRTFKDVSAAIQAITHYATLAGVIAAGLVTRYLIRAAVKTSAVATWQALASTRPKPNAAPTPSNAAANLSIDRFAGTIVWLIVLQTFLLPFVLRLLSGMGVRGLSTPITLAAWGVLLWWRHGKPASATVNKNGG